MNFHNEKPSIHTLCTKNGDFEQKNGCFFALFALQLKISHTFFKKTLCRTDKKAIHTHIFAKM